MDCQQFLNNLFLRNAKQGQIISQARAVLGSLPIVLKALMDKSNSKIRVVTSANAVTGSTDMKSVVILPKVPLPNDKDDVTAYVDMAALLYGLIHHEVGHINDTAPGYMEQCSCELQGHLLNIIEDVRQENLHIRRFPAARAYLNALDVVMFKQGKLTAVSATDSPVRIFTGYLLYRLYAEFRNDPIARELYPSAKSAIEQVYPNGFLTRLNPIIAKFPAAASTQATFNMSLELMQFLAKEEKDEEERKQQDDSNQQASSGQSGNGSNQAGDQTQPQNTAGQKSGSDASSSEDPNSGTSNQASSSSGSPGDNSSSGDGTQSQPQQSNGAGNGAGGPKAPLTQLLQAPDMDDALGNIHEQARQQLDSMVKDKRGNTALDLTTKENLGQIDLAQGSLNLGAGHDLGPALTVSGPLRRKLMSQLDALTNPLKTADRKGRKLSGRHITRIISGDPRVFEVKDEGRDIDSAVLLLQDVSGSMSGEKVRVASQALFASAMAMSGIDGLELSAMTFPGNAVVIRSNESARRHQARFDLASYGGTPMTEAIQLGTRMLLATKRSRQLMIVLTDGAPDNHVTAATAIATAGAQGIEVYGIGILTNQFRPLFDQWQTINDLHELPEKLTSMIRDKVFGRLAA